MGALSSLLNILDGADKLAHQNRARETTVLCSWVHEWLMVWANNVSYDVFLTICIRHEVWGVCGCVQKARWTLQQPLHGSNIHGSYLMRAAGKQSSRLLPRPGWVSVRNLPRTPDSVITSQLIAWINGWRCLSHVSNRKQICSVVAMIGSIPHTSPESQTPDWQPLYTAGRQAGDLSCNMWQRHWN